MESSVAGPGDIDSVTACLTYAFSTDPIWSVALVGIDDEAYWRILVEGAMRFGTVRQWDSGAAVSVWIPPNESDLTPELEERSQALLASSLDAEGTTAINELLQRFETSRSDTPEPHAYLALLATHRDYRGQGIGQALLASNLSEWDALGIPTYLESSNPSNDHLYVRLGFKPIGGFDAVIDNARVTAMWRPVATGPE